MGCMQLSLHSNCFEPKAKLKHYKIRIKVAGRSPEEYWQKVTSKDHLAKGGLLKVTCKRSQAG
eukprot:1159855-Pelagomonas_calceolata.AAC.6